MSFLLNDVVPWGRNLKEYRKMFSLTDDDMKGRIASFGDGPASFNCEASKNGTEVVSYDIIYQFSKEDIERRIEEVRGIVMQQMAENMEHYNWSEIKNLFELEQLRMDAMRLFLTDYESGRKDGRYIFHALPDKVDLKDNYYDLGLSSHFLLMYENLGYEFHINAIKEMMRLCREVRIFPICNLDGKATELAQKVIQNLKRRYEVEIVKSDYHFQKSTNEMLVIKEGE